MTERPAARRGVRVWLVLLLASSLALPVSAWWSVEPMSAVLSGQAKLDGDADTSYRYVLMPVRFAS